MIFKMIIRKNELTISLLFLTTLRITESQDAKSYDTNDWIPIRQPEHKIQKKAAGRVLTLPEPSQLRFFPEEYRSTRQADFQQQYLRETLNANNQRNPHHRQQTKQPFTPQQLEQYYIDQRKRVEEQRRLQALQESHQYEILPSKPYNNVAMQSKLLKPTYDSLPTEFLSPPSPQQLQPALTHHYIFPSNPDAVPLIPEATPIQVNNPIPSVTQFVRQPPGANGTVDFYNNLNQNFHGNNARQNRPIELTTTTQTPAKENVQLLYLPIEQIQFKQTGFERQQPIVNHQSNLNQQQTEFQRNTNRGLVNNNQETLLRNIENDFIQQALQAHKLQAQLEKEVPTPETIVKKRKPHQPPLAVYMTGQENAPVKDVVRALKESKTINVQDTIGIDNPHVFVGPANLNTPSGFSKFDLPYLSNIESNRVERKVDQLPFFVAPLNYKIPPGYEKIPFPPPHVGSVVLNLNSLGSDERRGFQNYRIPEEVTFSSADIHQQSGEEAIQNPTQRPLRQRGRQRITTIPAIETTTYSAFNPTFNYQYQSGILTSTPSANNIKQIAPQTQFNQNKYFPGVSLDQLREYQVDKTHQQLPIHSDTQENPKQLYNYLEITTEVPELYNSHESFPEKRKPKPTIELSTIGQTVVIPFNQKLHSISSQVNNYNHVAPVTPPTTTTTTTTTTPAAPKFEEYIKLVKVAEEMIIRPQSNGPLPQQFALAPQEDPVQFQETPEYNNEHKKYLPINSQQPVQQVNYDNLFEAPFVTNSEVNQINSAAKSTIEKPKSRQHVELKYMVVDEYPIKINASITPRPEPYSKPKSKQDIVIINPQSDSVNDLVDPSIRQLLTPGLLVPTEKPKAEYSILDVNKKHAEYTPETIEYKPAVTTTTPKPEVVRVRNRGRGGSRYNDRTTTYSPRRISVRTRSRTRLTTTTTEQERESYTTAPTPRSVSTRQRFRVRGKPMISQGYSSTVSNVQPTTEYTTIAAVPFIPEEVVNENEQNKYESVSFAVETVSKPQLITRAKNLSPEEEYLVTKYNLPLSDSQDNKSERYNVEIVTDKEAEALDDAIRFSTLKKAEESTTIYTPVVDYPIRSIHKSTEKPRIRQRARIRSRITTVRTTTSPPTTTEAPNVEDTSFSPEEFYGFFRPPNFKSTPKNDYTVTPKAILQIKEDDVDDEATDERIQIIPADKGVTVRPIQFVGEILPKYSTTEKYFEITPELAPISDMYVMTTPPTPQTTKKRTRGRIPSTRRPVETKESSEESEQVVPNTLEYKPNPKIKTRGRVHFKVPLIVTTEVGDDNNNYPALYLKAQHDQEDYTPQTSPHTEQFKITVDPGYEDDGDQEPHPSLVSSKFAIPSNQVHFPSNSKEMKYLGGKHVHFNGSDFHANITTVKLLEVELVTDPTEGAEKPKRKGYWKLIKKKNPEDFEVAESQNIGIVRDNDFERAVTKERITAGENPDIEDLKNTVSTIREEHILSTTAPIYTKDDAQIYDDDISTNKKIEVDVTSPNPRILMDGIRTSTSTSTEISGDAEICSKGICVKSEDYDQ